MAVRSGAADHLPFRPVAQPVASESPPKHRGRGRPPDPEHAARQRVKIVVAAYELFAERGYHDTAVADIAERADIGRGSFYLHFESKRDVLDAVLDHVLEHLLGGLETDASSTSLATIDDFESSLRAVADRLFAALDAKPALAQFILRDGLLDAEITQRLLGLADVLSTLAAGYLQQGVQTGFLRDDLDTENVAEGLIGLALSGLLRAMRSPLSSDERKRYIDALVTFAREGARRHPPPQA